MKYKINVVLVVLLGIASLVVAGLSIDNKSITTQLTQKDETIMQLRNDNADLSKRLYETMTTKISTSNKVVQTQKQTLSMDSEDQCKTNADKYFTGFESLSSFKRSTYRSHWNTNLKACLIEITMRKTNSDGSISTGGIISYDLTNDKKIMVCSNEGLTENVTSCSDSIFITFEDLFMSQ